MRDGDRALMMLLATVLVVGLVAGGPELSAQESVKLDGYAEWKPSAGLLVVDAQRVRVNERTKWKGKFQRVDDVPLGFEVRVTGTRQADGTVLAREIDARANGNALFENDVQAGTQELEGAWLRSGSAFEADQAGKKKVIGEIETEGRHVARVRGLVRRLAPPYVDQSKLRVYVIDNKEWNAMAMGNGAIWVFRGIMDDMSDNELAIVVGHELAHYTHEHTRRQMRRGMWTQLAGLGAIIAAEAIDNDAARAGAQAGAALGMMALTSGYGRDLEDQADRIGLRYAYQGGFDVQRAPAVWGRFLEKYGEQDRLTIFFFSDHSLASARRKNLQQEIRFNYAR
jgi:Zn-dependent protease with chaperone function